MSNSFSNDHCIVYRPRSGALKFHYALRSKYIFINKISGTLNQNTHYMFRKIKIIEVLISIETCLQKVISINILIFTPQSLDNRK